MELDREVQLLLISYTTQFLGRFAYAGPYGWTLAAKVWLSRPDFRQRAGVVALEHYL
jgi:hypothetical protein